MSEPETNIRSIVIFLVVYYNFLLNITYTVHKNIKLSFFVKFSKYQ